MEKRVNYTRPKHVLISEVLVSMDHELLSESKCWFGGGTAIVLRLGEYRESLDIDFMCADVDGYRELRTAFFESGIHSVFKDDVKAVREVKSDAYGIRGLVEYKGQLIKFEIVRESRISLEGERDPVIGVPTLVVSDMFAEKLLANADRCFDRAVAYRDAIDLGCLVDAYGDIPDEAVAKAEKAYGPDVSRKMAGVLNRLLDIEEIRHAATVLDMDFEAAVGAIASLRLASVRMWPDAGIEPDPEPSKDSDYGF